MLSYKVKGVEGSINRYGGNSNDMELWFAFEKRKKLRNGFRLCKELSGAIYETRNRVEALLSSMFGAIV